MDPLPDPNVDAKELKKFFPTYHRTNPLASKPETNDEDNVKSNSQVKIVGDNQAKSLTESLKIEKPINLNYMSDALRAFHSCPLSKDLEPYLAWLTKIEKEKAQFWKEMGIYDMIRLSKVGSGYSQTHVNILFIFLG